MMKNVTDKDAGFGLLEALVALVVVALALSALCQAIGNAYRASARTKSYAASIIAAQSQLSRLGIDEPLQSGSFAGTYSNNVRWRMTVTPLDKQVSDDAAPPDSRAYWVSLEVVDRRGKDVFVLQTAKMPGRLP
ncbi:prepilin-type N-terminal cleavage/methylation domain-containing protein [Hyphomicrobium sp. 99]|uniref:prepilin-type N-terminal cleavage/methylation domain-containing protein n=1 Tax=Hyphomicrobium sp. 99 TaxID=1163419 RepID=UPI0005F80C53|nr:prepilin-type N-terminal cleavage/methylation domain-containing protein [Hyphomicrobium sp. 99]